MKLPDKAIKEFQDLFEKKHGKKLTWEEASNRANNIMESMQKQMEDDINEEITGEKKES